MTKKTSQPVFAHVEFVSRDAAKTRKFYETVFGWQFDDVGMDYLFATPPSGSTAGIMKPDGKQAAGTMTYIHVDDIDKAARAAQYAGAKVLRKREEIPNFGSFAVIEAPGGVAQGLYQPLEGDGSRRERSRKPSAPPVVHR